MTGSGINVIIVSAGFAGLSTAIECARRGMQVRVYEGARGLTALGDMIQLAPNATRIMSRWGKVPEGMNGIASEQKTCDFISKEGKLLLSQELIAEYDGFPNHYMHRSRTQALMYDHAVSLGIEVSFNSRITKFFENETEAGIYVGDEKVTADCVIASDGVHSRARVMITGSEDAPKPSGFAVYRCCFPIDAVKNDPKLSRFVKEDRDTLTIWIGEDTHGIFLTNRKLDNCTCFLTHKDIYTVEESWSFPGDLDDMIKCANTLQPEIADIFKHIPRDRLIDWKLLWRDPIEEWVSEHGRIALAGDSAHPYLPTSAQGAAQAIEDGACIGAVLECGGKREVPLSLKCYNRLRYERTTLTQRMGWETRHRYHQTDWEELKKHPEYLRFLFPHWLVGIDAGDYASENYNKVKDHLLNGAEFKSTNVPEGYKHELWTIEAMMAAEKELAAKQGSVIQDDW